MAAAAPPPPALLAEGTQSAPNSPARRSVGKAFPDLEEREARRQAARQRVLSEARAEERFAPRINRQSCAMVKSSFAERQANYLKRKEERRARANSLPVARSFKRTSPPQCVLAKAVAGGQQDETREQHACRGLCIVASPFSSLSHWQLEP